MAQASKRSCGWREVIQRYIDTNRQIIKLIESKQTDGVIIDNLSLESRYYKQLNKDVDVDISLLAAPKATSALGNDGISESIDKGEL